MGSLPVPQLVNPQSDDTGRSVLQFSEGKPLGERGTHWLAVHIANCYWKKSKVSYDKPVAWVDQHEREIIYFSENPIRVHRFWLRATVRSLSRSLSCHTITYPIRS
jgi:DNA-directed RNA polymerase, mitochondrial